MKRSIIPIIIVLLILTAGILFLPAAAEQAEPAEKADWTVMFYLCGSNLESKYSYATGNLEEINTCRIPYEYTIQLAEIYGYEVTRDMLPDPGKVNLTIQTGGCKEWHAQSLGLDIPTDKLQRWSFELIQEDGSGGYHLEEELPLASMADPETLTDFVRWNMEKYPAEKYALVLWDHGGGSKTGIFIDELFDNDVMYLYELRDALQNVGKKLDLVLFDACLMANLETAYIIRDCADYMVASEEVVVGQGTAIGKWMQELYYAPKSDAERLGRIICDTAQIKCANLEDEQAGEMITWSVIDLGKMDRVGECVNRFFDVLCRAYTQYPELMRIYAFQIINSERYGSRSDSMYDLASLFYNAGLYQTRETNIRQEFLEAIEDAVVYNVRGSDHFGARGLSFCYAPVLTPEELDVYEKNCPMPGYLALVDALSPWTAPDWVYEHTEKLPEIDGMEDYRIDIEKKICEDGTPGVNLAEGVRNVGLILLRWYRKNEETGEVVNMGLMPAYEGKTAEGEFLWRAYEPWNWVAVEGVPCCFNLISYYPGGTHLCEIPIRIGTDVWKLRVGYSETKRSYDIYGVWDGSEYVGQRFTRSVKRLDQMVGQNYQLLYPILDTKRTAFEAGPEQPFYRFLELSRMELPAGTYYLEYVIVDMFQRWIPMERIELNWNGEKLTMAEGTDWSGTVRLKWNGTSK